MDSHEIYYTLNKLNEYIFGMKMIFLEAKNLKSVFNILKLWTGLIKTRPTIWVRDHYLK